MPNVRMATALISLFRWLSSKINEKYWPQFIVHTASPQNVYPLKLRYHWCNNATGCYHECLECQEIKCLCEQQKPGLFSDWLGNEAMTFHFKVNIAYNHKNWWSLNLAVLPQPGIIKNIHIWQCCSSSVLHERWSQCRLARQSPVVEHRWAAALTVRMRIAVESYEVELY